MKGIFFDLETQHLAMEVKGGWNNIRGFGLSIAVTWDEENEFRCWNESSAKELIDELARFDKIIGFNLLGFDYEVLSAYRDDVHQLLDKATFDVMLDLARLKPDVKYPSLQEVSLATVDKGEWSKGIDMPRLFREGKIGEVLAHCKRDVELVRDIYRFGVEHGVVYYKGKIKVDWGEDQ